MAKAKIKRTLAERLEIQKEKVAVLEAVSTFRKIKEICSTVSLTIPARIEKVKALFVDEIINEYNTECDTQEEEN